MTKKRKLISSLSDLRFKLVEMWADIDEGKEVPKAPLKVKMADVLVKSIAVESMQNKASGIVRAIDFLEGVPDTSKPKLIDEFAKP